MLILVTFLVWGSIVYRIANGLSDKDTIVVKAFTPQKNEIGIILDSFTLYADYPDPFIPEKETVDSAIYSKVNIPPKPTNFPNSETPKINQEIVAGIIQFNGIVINPQNKSKIAIVSVHGKELIVREKEKVEDIVIRKIDRDRLKIMYKGRAFTIAKAR